MTLAHRSNRVDNGAVSAFTASASDADLARAAQGGDTPALGLLLERHRAALHAHALKLVGYAHAGDAVQDTFVLALRKFDQLRDPDAASAWLHTALRSICLSRLRRNHGELPIDEVDPPAPRREAPEENIERLALRDWVWTAIAELSEPLRIVAMLRYFGSYSSYEEIASICGVPVGTVRSRLNQVKLKLADGLLATAQAAHSEAAAAAAARERHIADAVAHFDRTGNHAGFVAPMTDDVEVLFPSGLLLSGRDRLEEGLAEDAAAGVHFVPTNVIAGPGLSILEARFINPSYDPFHCPPAIAQIHHHRGEETYRMVFHYADREGESSVS